MDRTRVTKVFLVMAICFSAVLGIACSRTVSGVDKPELKGVGEAGIGALFSQTSEGKTTGTVGSGAGVGYLKGNEADARGAGKRQAAVEQETLPLANTSWQVVLVAPKPAQSVRSMVGLFNPDGTLTTTTTYWDGRTITDSERYQIVGRTLIINHDTYAINATFLLDGSSLYMDTDEHHIELERR